VRALTVDQTTPRRHLRCIQAQFCQHFVGVLAQGEPD